MVKYTNKWHKNRVDMALNGSKKFRSSRGGLCL